jgi:hypothetical protein
MTKKTNEVDRQREWACWYEKARAAFPRRAARLNEGDDRDREDSVC